MSAQAGVPTLRDNCPMPLVKISRLFKASTQTSEMNVQQVKERADFADKCFKSTAFKRHNTALQNKGEKFTFIFILRVSSGHLSPSKFTELCRKVFGSKQAEELQEKAFSRFDKHNNGSVNFRDFLMVIHLTSNGAPEDKLRTMFSLYDLNNDGSIDSGEMER